MTEDLSNSCHVEYVHNGCADSVAVKIISEVWLAQDLPQREEKRGGRIRWKPSWSVLLRNKVRKMKENPIKPLFQKRVGILERGRNCHMFCVLHILNFCLLWVLRMPCYIEEHFCSFCLDRYLPTSQPLTPRSNLCSRLLEFALVLWVGQIVKEYNSMRARTSLTFYQRFGS